MNRAYKDFESGFIKQSVELGVDEAFLRGYLKVAQDEQDAWIEVVKIAEAKSGDPEFRTKIANVILAMPRIYKQADMWTDVKGLGNGVDFSEGGMSNLMGNVGNIFGGGAGLGGGLMGGGGGALVGLLIAKALGIDPSWGLLLGGLGGGALGGLYGHSHPNATNSAQVHQANPQLNQTPPQQGQQAPPQPPAGTQAPAQPQAPPANNQTTPNPPAAAGKAAPPSSVVTPNTLNNLREANDLGSQRLLEQEKEMQKQGPTKINPPTTTPTKMPGANEGPATNPKVVLPAAKTTG